MQNPGPDPDPDPSQQAAADAAPGDFATEVLQHLASHRDPFRRYRIEGEIARGGQGAILRVWDEDLSRNLAMKVVLGTGEPTADRPSPVDSKTLGRFMEEARVTGQLDHPGVVPIHELGLDDQGQVYFTMKLVKGRDLKAIFELEREGQEGWSKTRALNVILKVCEAMAYAHSKGVIHRDLKPGNVMVGQFGEVYVMDWGLARVQGTKDRKDLRIQPAAMTTQVRSGRGKHASEAPDSPLVTMDGDVVGTPAYMPPEQARGELENMGPHSDVYAVGAMLYQLLAGHMPYVPPGAKLNNYAIWSHVQSAPPPSLVSVAPQAPAELVAICEKAMARESSDRYPTMAELAEDLRAFLEGRVVQAYRTGAVTELRKWVGRNKPLAGALAAAVMLMAAGLVITLALHRQALASATVARENEEEARIQGERARQQEQEARRNEALAKEQEQLAMDRERIAQRHADLALQNMQFVITNVNARLKEQAQTTELRRSLMTELIGNFKELEVEFTEDGVAGTAIPTLMALKMELALILADLGDTRAAGVQLDELYEMGQRRLEVKGRTDQARSNLAKILVRMADTRAQISRDVKETLALRNEALDLIRDVLDHPTGEPGGPTLADTRSVLTWALQGIAADHLNQGDLAKAAKHFEEALQIRATMLAELRAREGFENLSDGERDQQTYSLQMEHDRSALGLAYVLLRLGRRDESLVLYEQALAGRREIAHRYPLDRFPQMRSLHSALGGFCGNYGNALLWLDELTEAEPLLRESLASLESLHALEPDVSSTRRDLATAHYRVGTLEDELGNPEQARLEFEQCRELRQELTDRDPTEKNRTSLMLALARCGDQEPATRIAEELQRSQDAEIHLECARAYAQLARSAEPGQVEALTSTALDALQRAVELGYGDPFRVSAESDLDPVRAQPRYRTILESLEDRSASQ